VEATGKRKREIFSYWRVLRMKRDFVGCEDV
jgi:hypothetical protein